VSPSFHASPIRTLEQLRATALSVMRMKLPIVGKIWMCVTHEARGAMLKDKETFVRDPANAGIQTQARILSVLPRSIGLLALNRLGHDGP
jgi:hypothetical protein